MMRRFFAPNKSKSSEDIIDSSSSSGSGDPDEEGSQSSDSSHTESHSGHGSDSGSGTNPSTKDGGDVDAQEEIEQLVVKETQRMQLFRFVLILLVLLTGLIVGAGTYVFLYNKEYSTYITGYYDFSELVMEQSNFYVRNMFEAFQDLSDSVTLAANKTNASFPFVTASYFELMSNHVRKQTGFATLLWAPLVPQHYSNEWLDYSSSHISWLQDSRDVAVAVSDKTGGNNLQRAEYRDTKVATAFYANMDNGTATNHDEGSVRDGNHLPVWQQSPPPIDMDFVNQDLFTQSYIKNAFTAVNRTKGAVYSPTVNFEHLYHKHGNETVVPEDTEFISTRKGVQDRDGEFDLHPKSALIQPIFKVLNDPKSGVAGILLGTVEWDLYLLGLLPEGVTGIFCVLTDTCGGVFTFLIDGPRANYLGQGDLHDSAFDYTAFVIELGDYSDLNLTISTPGHCMYSITTYSSKTFEDSATTSTPVILACAVAALFLVVAITFCSYDVFVQGRNAIVINAAVRANSILNSLFPKSVRERMFREMEEEKKMKKSNMTAKSHLNQFLQNDDRHHHRRLGDEDTAVTDDKPIADLFPETTILFADIAGFTAWSSVREPAQVFILLETVYHAFDLIAKRRHIFKVETVGDCYVAVTGLPEPRKDHAIAMCRFARDCMFKFRGLTKKLEVTLGPDTSELDMRMGINSGPVTAGVLRGDRSRFQLFGDTMNTASRMETTSEKGRIQLSQETAQLIRASGKEKWLVLRDEAVVAKGKGEMQTYWLAVGEERRVSIGIGSSIETNSTNTDSIVDDLSVGAQERRAAEAELDREADKMMRLVEWNVEVLSRLLKQIIARRNASKTSGVRGARPREEKFLVHATNPLDEAVDIIQLPKFDAEAARKQEDIKNIQLPPEVVEQLFRLVTDIAKMYNDNPFHNFEHASHVTMSVNKLLSRIAAPDIEYHEDAAVSGETLHDHTYGITSDPLTQFACIFGALIHDVDHSGVPNAQLVQERAAVARYYNGKTIAEQNSVDIAWKLLMDDEFRDVRKVIYTSDEELRRFRQLVINAVMATDIADKDLKVQRNERWAKAFSDEKGGKSRDASETSVNRKATIVIEHLIQASDVAHTMQHWFVYRKWNEMFFMECYKAYKEGRSETDPSENWYKGEIGFFDFYIIPLAKKLKDCGVFGVSSDEYLNYALQNRKKWEETGHEAVAEFIENAKGKHWGKRPSRSSPSSKSASTSV